MNENSKKKRMLYVGISHSAGDSRLCHFLARAVRDQYPDVDCLYLGMDSNRPEVFSGGPLTVLRAPRGMNLAKRRFRLDDMRCLSDHIEGLGIDLVQISDVRELMLGHALKTRTAIPVIFDAHEDYFNQRYEYSQKSLKGLVQGILSRTNELLNIRYMDAVFCTDPFLETLYRMPLFAAPRVVTMRNIPARTMIRSHPVINARDSLKLVYLGSVNALRGINEAARHCARFNAESEAERRGVQLSFHVFSKPNPIVEKLSGEGLLTHHGYIPQTEITEAIADYDIGVSLILPSKKFSRNILIKNFEYMAMGLPILTSNYGTMKQYVGEAGAGLMIEPTDYTAFKEAIVALGNQTFRRQCGQNGLAYARRSFDRDAEAAPYLDTVGRLLGILG